MREHIHACASTNERRENNAKKSAGEMKTDTTDRGLFSAGGTSPSTRGKCLLSRAVDRAGCSFTRAHVKGPGYACTHANEPRFFAALFIFFSFPFSFGLKALVTSASATRSTTTGTRLPLNRSTLDIREARATRTNLTLLTIQTSKRLTAWRNRSVRGRRTDRERKREKERERERERERKRGIVNAELWQNSE